jgi:3D (Asp-Asp-Asp) domain-containing protein
MKRKNFFVFKSFYFMFPLMMFFLAACGDKAADKPIAAQQNYGMPGLAGPNELYCPEGYSYDAKYHQCFGQSGVLGPFSNSMVNKCKSFGGGAPCEGLHWEREFAQELRGQELCPAGTQWETRLSVCADGENVFGPFLKTQHDSCMKANGGSACETMRWSRQFFDSMNGVPDNKPSAEPGPVQSFNFREPYDSEIVRVKSAWATYYKIPTVRDVGKNGYPLLDMSGRSLGAALHAEDWCHASLEGSVRVLASNGTATVFNYVGSYEELKQVDCSPWISLPGLGYSRFYKAKGSFGDGVSGYLLYPYRTIAVDPGWVPYGTVLYIPAARGTLVKMPDGSEQYHDGYFFAADTGGALYGNHIDVFIGSAVTNPFKFVRSTKSSTFEIFVIGNPKIKELLTKRHSEN